MYKLKILFFLFFGIFLFPTFSQVKPLKIEAAVKETMLKATQFMVEKASVNGGYVWYYLPDFSRQWGEMEAYKTMIWLQHPGTISMGHLFLDAYQVTGNDYYYQAAKNAAAAVIWGQSHEGGWNYMIDFAGDRSLKQWYNTVGKNGWRLEEFQHYYGNSTFDDNITSDAARFLLRMYLEKLDPAYKPALDKAIDFILTSQYPLGGWPQRYPLKYDYNKSNHLDYSSYYTFNDEVIWENIHFLIQCYETLGEERFLDPILRGMNFYLIAQDASGAWGNQYNMALQPMGARTYEPEGLVTPITCLNAMQLITFYKYTGNPKFLLPVSKSIEWLEQTRLPASLTDDGKYTHPYYIDKQSGKSIYVHRKGPNVSYGYYYSDSNPENLIAHSKGKRNVPLEMLKTAYNLAKSISSDTLTKFSPLLPFAIQVPGNPQKKYNLNRDDFEEVPSLDKVKQIVSSLDEQKRWLTKHAFISNPYIGDGKNQVLTSQYSGTYVGDETDTSPFRDSSDQQYISTGDYIQNMRWLINFLHATVK